MNEPVNRRQAVRVYNENAGAILDAIQKADPRRSWTAQFLDEEDPSIDDEKLQSHHLSRQQHGCEGGTVTVPRSVLRHIQQLGDAHLTALARMILGVLE